MNQKIEQIDIDMTNLNKSIKELDEYMKMWRQTIYDSVAIPKDRLYGKD